jgi:hypothetical protein
MNSKWEISNGRKAHSTAATSNVVFVPSRSLELKLKETFKQLGIIEADIW